MADEYNEVSITISPATKDKLLPFSFLETQLYNRMSQLLVDYMPAADIRYMISEIKEDLYSGFTSIDNQKLHTLVHHCKKCSKIFSPDPQAPSWNCVDPDLMIIAASPKEVAQSGHFLFTALKEAGFTSQRCMLTYATRCSYELPVSNTDVIENCIPYLHTELAITNPKLVLTLGLPAFKMMTGSSLTKLGDVIGSILSWGTYFILPEVSLGALEWASGKEKTTSMKFIQSLQKAHSYLYSGG